MESSSPEFVYCDIRKKDWFLAQFSQVLPGYFLYSRSSNDAIFKVEGVRWSDRLTMMYLIGECHISGADPFPCHVAISFGNPDDERSSNWDELSIEEGSVTCRSHSEKEIWWTLERLDDDSNE